MALYFWMLYLGGKIHWGKINFMALFLLFYLFELILALDKKLELQK